MRGNPYVFSRFDSGVNLEAAPYSIDAGFGRLARNMHSSPEGAIVKRNGCITAAEPEVTFTSLFGCNLSTDIMIGAGGTKLYSVSTSNVIKTLKTGLSPGAMWEWIQAPISGGQGPIYGVNGIDTPQFWDGVSEKTEDWTASEGSIPNGKVIAYHENRVFIAVGSTLYWSDITDPRNFASPKGGSTKVDPEDGEDITALGKVGPYLMICKERKTFLLIDTNEGAYRRVSDDMGCISNRSMVATEVGTFFVTPDAEIIITDGQDFTKKISIPIQPILKNLNGPVARRICGVHVADNVWFSFSENGSVNDTIIEFNIKNNAWWIHKITYSSHAEEEQTNYGGVGNFGGEGVFGNVGSNTGGVNQFVTLDPSDITTLYAAGANTTLPRILNMYVDDEFTDCDNQIYQAYWISPWHVFTYPHLRKRMREIRVDSLGNYDLFTATSFSNILTKEEEKIWEYAEEELILEGEEEIPLFGGSGNFGGTGTFGDVAIIAEKRFYTPGIGRAWSLKFESEDNQDLQIFAYTTAINYKKD